MRATFGLDLAGYSSGRSGFARARYDGGVIDVTVYRGTVFGRPLAGIAPLPEHAAEERALLRACCERGLVFVDIPIDLQGLPTPGGVSFPWQLVKRPVDFASGALAPLADRIGAPVARFRHILAPLLTESPDLLGRRLFETYPAATLDLLELRRRGYKGIRGREALAKLGRDLRISHAEDEMLSDDELDAAICAITGAVDDGARLQGDDLDAEITRRIRDKMPTHGSTGIPTAPPTGYVPATYPAGRHDPPGCEAASSSCRVALRSGAMSGAATGRRTEDSLLLDHDTLDEELVEVEAEGDQLESIRSRSGVAYRSEKRSG